ncbi:Flagellar motor switch protein FliN [Desulfovibrionales bacterium]
MGNDIDQDGLTKERATALAGSEGGDRLGFNVLGSTAMPPDSVVKPKADVLIDEWAAALASEEGDRILNERNQEFYSYKVQAAEFEGLIDETKAPAVDSSRHELDFILDIPLDVSAELGRTRLLINELLHLGQGSVVELNKLIGEPLEVYVNGKLVARGEAVVIKEKLGVRLTDIISPIARVKQLG